MTQEYIQAEPCPWPNETSRLGRESTWASSSEGSVLAFKRRLKEVLVFTLVAGVLGMTTWITVGMLTNTSPT